MSSQKSRPNPGTNRQQKRQYERQSPNSGSKKPLALRILIIAMLVVMLLGFVLFPLLK